VRLGCGRALPRPRYDARSATSELKALLDNPGYAARAAEAGEVVRGENGASVAADAIERVLAEV